jgi:hypothetical protein
MAIRLKPNLDTPEVEKGPGTSDYKVIFSLIEDFFNTFQYW